MLLLAVLLGYILGVAPFFIPKIIEYINVSKDNKSNNKKDDYSEILSEYLNGPKNKEKVTENQPNISGNQSDILAEYLTGKVQGGQE